MKKIYALLVSVLPVVLAHSQTTIQFPPDTPGHKTEIKVFPNPAQGEVQVKIINWDIKSRYTINVLNANGKRISTKVAQRPVEPVMLNTGGRRKATLFIEVWKDKTILGKEMVVVIK